ncbi:uncharacterized mitochondrial protein AtMg00310-like [Primulina eburnea]|uniref:uncharacterized mitochondrial protein AtMg00310-like n=1 Tax=Primulina eburnea TaxID=1245227 RepID=UPI003C6C0E6C
MSCFRITKLVCEEIERECSNFWWGVGEGKRRMHWKFWKELCQPKCMGGLGFRHLETFNKALLAKQIWRILVDPGSLVGHVLKTRYFRRQDIMEAGLGSNPSYLWRSLLWSRSLLDIGLCWHVGNGAKINLVGDRWIPRSKIRISQSPNLDNRKVRDLIDNGSWKVSVVQQLFSPHLVHDILAIPLPATPHEDFRFWLFDAKGKYTVREGYKAASGFYVSPLSSSSITIKSW